MKIKVCGMREPDNIAGLASLKPDYVGFVFYSRSPRYAGEMQPKAALLPATIRRVGVFVDAGYDAIVAAVRRYGLNAVQLHGSEGPGLCARLRGECEVIKAFGVECAADLGAAKAYEGTCDRFLFDTRTPAYGGAGVSFDWRILQEYAGTTPFFLSGGIGPADAPRVSAFVHPLLYGVDINSRFEVSPGRKDIESIKNFIKAIR